MPPSSSSRSSSKSSGKSKKTGRFEGKTVIVTGKLSDDKKYYVNFKGSSSGMGQTIAVRFATEGANVMLHGRDEKGVKVSKFYIILSLFALIVDHY